MMTKKESATHAAQGVESPNADELNASELAQVAGAFYYNKIAFVGNAPTGTDDSPKQPEDKGFSFGVER